MYTITHTCIKATIPESIAPEEYNTMQASLDYVIDQYVEALKSLYPQATITLELKPRISVMN